MKRRELLGGSIAGGLALGSMSALARTPERPRSDLPAKFAPSAYAVPSTQYSPFATPDYYTYADDLVIERNRPGKPHAGKGHAAVQAHADRFYYMDLRQPSGSKVDEYVEKHTVRL